MEVGRYLCWVPLLMHWRPSRVVYTRIEDMIRSRLWRSSRTCLTRVLLESRRCKDEDCFRAKFRRKPKYLFTWAILLLVTASPINYFLLVISTQYNQSSFFLVPNLAFKPNSKPSSTGTAPLNLAVGCIHQRAPPGMYQLQGAEHNRIDMWYVNMEKVEQF